MDFTLTRFIAFFQILCLFFAIVKSAPTGHGPQNACADVRKSALEFNGFAKENAGRKDIKKSILPPMSNPTAWMEAQDMCDPGSLRQAPEPCLKKMLDVLTSYKSLVKTVAGFGICPEAREVKPLLQQLYDNMSICLRSRMGYHHHRAINENELQTQREYGHFEQKMLCQYTMERLFSFSILTARVFSVGDPSNHDESTAPNCAQRN